MKNKLTGKCKEEFLKQLKFSESIFINTSETFQNALIIEFFDSVGHIGDETIIQILINELIANRSVSEATNAAIEKANELYNQNKPL